MILSFLVKLLIVLMLTLGGSVILSVIFWGLDRFEIRSDRRKICFQKSLGTYSAWIGYFERLVIYGLLATNNIISISLVITLKGFMRYPEISHNINGEHRHKLNAEKFLLGTLFSIVYTAVIFLLFN